MAPSDFAVTLDSENLITLIPTSLHLFIVLNQQPRRFRVVESTCSRYGRPIGWLGNLIRLSQAKWRNPTGGFWMQYIELSAVAVPSQVTIIVLSCCSGVQEERQPRWDHATGLQLGTAEGALSLRQQQHKIMSLLKKITKGIQSLWKTKFLVVRTQLPMRKMSWKWFRGALGGGFTSWEADRGP